MPEKGVYCRICDHIDRTNDDQQLDVGSWDTLFSDKATFLHSNSCCSEDQNDIEADLRCILTQIEGCGFAPRRWRETRENLPRVILNGETKVRAYPVLRKANGPMVMNGVQLGAFPCLSSVYPFSSLAAQSWLSSAPCLKGFACCRISGFPAL